MEKAEVLVKVYEQHLHDATPQLSIDAVPLAQALHTILRWPEERRRGVTIHMPDRVVPWTQIDELYALLYRPRGPGLGGSVVP
jgi:hypothetical protein